MAFSGRDAVAGGISGGSAGMSTGNPWAALAGAGVGALAGGFMGGGAKGIDPNFITNQIKERVGQIQGYQQQLAAARQNYMSHLNNLQNLTFSRFMPMMEAQFAGRGLSPSGGAYQSALAKQSAMLQAQGQEANAKGEIEDLNNVQNLMSSAYGQGMPLQAGLAQYNQGIANAPDPMMGALGQLTGAFLQARMGPKVVSSPQEVNPQPSRMPNYVQDWNRLG